MPFLRILVVTIIAAGFGGCANKNFNEKLNSLYSNTVPLISPGELAVLKEDSLATIFLLDTREKKEFQVSHLQNAKWVGYDDFEIKSVENIPRDATIITYCTVGYRSEKIGEIIAEAGYTKVYNLHGSIIQWVNEGFPVYNMDGKETKLVHTYNKKWSKWLKNGEAVYD